MIPSHRRRSSAALLVAALLGTLLLGTPASATAATGAPATAPPKQPEHQYRSYVALGDSYSSGVGTGQYDLAEAPCLRSSAAFPALWARQRPSMTFTFLACSGSTSIDLIRDQVALIPSGADLLTVTTGGNDAGFGTIARACSAGSPDQACTAAIAVGRVTVRTTAPAGLAAVLFALRRAAPDARIVVLGYPRPFTSGLCLGQAPGDTHHSELNQLTDGLNDSLAWVTRTSGAHFAEVRPAFAEHGLCAAPGQSWLNAPETGVPAAYHPTAVGYAAGYLPVLTASAG